MLSICIPVYNFNVVALIKELHYQASQLNISFEILAIDDGSKDSFKFQNRAIENLGGVRYVELAINVGRSKIRNLLASQAKYDYLLFMDCDSAVFPDYLANYVEQLKATPKIVCGGRIYEKQCPGDNLVLHWRVGTAREVKTAAERNKHPNCSFASNNFLIRKELLLKNLFYESLEGYGHEDTLFGFYLKRAGVIIHHIDNEVVHVGLETNDHFFRKQIEGLKNLLKIYHLSGKNQELVNDIKLLKTFQRVKNMGLSRWGHYVFKLFHHLIKKHLIGKNPNLNLFDLYKLLYLLHIDFCKTKGLTNEL